MFLVVMKGVEESSAKQWFRRAHIIEPVPDDFVMKSFTLETSPLSEYIFVDRFFDFNVIARVDKSVHRCSHRLRLQVHVAGTDRAIPFELDLAPALLQLVDGVCTVSARIREAARLEGDGAATRCVVQVEALDADGQPIAAVLSNQFVCIRHQVRIGEEQSSKYEFYKDIGGKDKGIEFRVTLSEGANREVAITPVLLYESGQIVQDQNILQTADDKSALIVRSGEPRDLKFRINQVSSKHLNQAFCIQIAPDLVRCPDAADVMPAVSVPIEVKSKIKRPSTEAAVAQRQADQFANKRFRSAEAMVDGSLGLPDAGAAALQLLTDLSDFSDSIYHLHSWCQEVAVALETKIKWKPIGYENIEGHKGKVLMHDIVNPNDTVNYLLQQ